MAKVKVKVKMPTEFEVFGQTVTIDYLNKPILMEDSRIAYGVYYKERHHIDIGPHDTEAELIKTVLHELGHALLDRLGLWQTSLSLDLHELIVEAYSKFIYEQFTMKVLVSRKPRSKPRKNRGPR